ncbi:uncharacterized protein B0I36DRAFT_352980 [Microdochium trichocladiopsis]|uniref:Uncharacterized protein n=1 Tax=Microdochium trichocladiopsis TaxID=1682393 RepID=A0A9P8XXS7_9PEZI|nr:uncharacterized protein B0I36DRAFT_352980 [Microdochium trichocladiopsis]KAH7024783.1 hypothetical protein B0I36DRAFT_352980 [Microdochium trichocladiopsis]
MIGYIYSPSEVWVNAGFPRALDDRYIKEALSEFIKMALSQSTSLLDSPPQDEFNDKDWMASVINGSANLRTGIMKRDSDYGDEWTAIMLRVVLLGPIFMLASQGAEVSVSG